MKKNKTIIGVIVLLILLFVFIGCDTKEVSLDISDEDIEIGEKITYPTSNINGIVPWGAGGGCDTVVRKFVPEAEKALGKSIILTNKSGASGSIGHQYVFDQGADGYTLLFNTEVATMYQVLGISDLSYDEFDCVCLYASVPGVLVVAKHSPYNTLEDIIEDAKANPGKIKIGTTGIGSTPYRAALMLEKHTGAKFTVINFDGDAALMTNLLNKEIDCTVPIVSSPLQHIEKGDMKALALISNEPNHLYPDIPTLSSIIPETESDLDFFGPIFTVNVKKGTPKDIYLKLEEAFMVAFESDDFKQFCAQTGYVPIGISGSEANEYIRNYQAINSWLIYDAGGAKESPERFGISRIK